MPDTGLLTAERFFFGVMIYSFFGWIYESILESCRQKKLINRGFLNGPYLPIYGVGSMMDVTLLGWIENPFILFTTSAVLTCALEFMTSVVMEKMFNLRWWDYTDFKFTIRGKSINVGKFNIQGRVCLAGAVAFGTLSILLVYFIHPVVSGLEDQIPTYYFHIICGVLLAVVLIDLTITMLGFIGFNDKLSQLSAALEKARTNMAGIRENIDNRVTGSVAYEKITGSAAYEKLTGVYALFAENLSSQQVRLINSFPQLSSLKDRNLTDGLRKALSRRRKKKEPDKEEDVISQEKVVSQEN